MSHLDIQRSVTAEGFLDRPHAAVGTAPANRVRRRSRRAVLLGLLRTAHLYVGLWGAALGLLFGATGILMNHRAVMKIPVETAVQKTAQLPLPEPGFGTPQQMANWLQKEL
ncbi:MAG: PepSY-associated TM helix domain-containing protein, partial [Giesbergeria sp.]